MASLDEQETTITHIRSNKTILIYTANAVHLRKLRKESRATEVNGGEDWAEFTVSASDFDPLTGFKRRTKPLTEQQRAERADRMRKLQQMQQQSKNPDPA